LGAPGGECLASVRRRIRVVRPNDRDATAPTRCQPGGLSSPDGTIWAIKVNLLVRTGPQRGQNES
jgi:hypothetical protein